MKRITIKLEDITKGKTTLMNGKVLTLSRPYGKVTSAQLKEFNDLVEYIENYKDKYFNHI